MKKSKIFCHFTPGDISASAVLDRAVANDPPKLKRLARGFDPRKKPSSIVASPEYVLVSRLSRASEEQVAEATEWAIKYFKRKGQGKPTIVVNKNKPKSDKGNQIAILGAVGNHPPMIQIDMEGVPNDL